MVWFIIGCADTWGLLWLLQVNGCMFQHQLYSMLYTVWKTRECLVNSIVELTAKYILQFFFLYSRLNFFFLWCFLHYILVEHTYIFIPYTTWWLHAFWELWFDQISLTSFAVSISTFIILDSHCIQLSTRSTIARIQVGIHFLYTRGTSSSLSSRGVYSDVPQVLA